MSGDCDNSSQDIDMCACARVNSALKVKFIEAKYAAAKAAASSAAAAVSSSSLDSNGDGSSGTKLSGNVYCLQNEKKGVWVRRWLVLDADNLHVYKNDVRRSLPLLLDQWLHWVIERVSHIAYE